jgi:hypothetical protein
MFITGSIKKVNQLFAYFLAFILLVSCKHQSPLFIQIKPAHSGIFFNNLITENDSINQLDIQNVYNGGGVGIGDFNNDGWPDVYFTGNLVSCKLYLNKGDFKFQDVTEAAHVTGDGKWCRGVAVVDINNDGKPDIYGCATLKNRPDERRNFLYVNQGVDKKNVPYFMEMATEYGLDDCSHSTQAAFFDYDNDGDIDVYIVVNEINDKISPYLFHPILKDGSNPSTGKLLRNDWSESLNHPVFTDVSKQAGIQTEGYGNAASITDINNDGWKDIYISNDYFSNDLLWINNHDGTFSEQFSRYFKHGSASAMGNDVGDMNNDGLMDFITLDMNPEDNFRKKMMLNPNSYQLYQNIERYGYSYQYVRNTLQLNQGPGVGEEDSIGSPVFSEISYYAGIEATDWSWAPLLADFDNDGFRDIFIANGFPRDITDHDFGMFRNKAFLTSSKSQILKQIPEVRLHNYIFRNNGDLCFSDVSGKWGMTAPTFSNGTAYADLDKDGDLDLIINNINEEASLYRNKTRELHRDVSHYLQIGLQGDLHNMRGLGTRIEIFYDHGQRQVWENQPCRGYLSTVEDIAHFGLGKIQSVDSVLVKWQNERTQSFRNVPADQLLKVNVINSTDPVCRIADHRAAKTLFKEITRAAKIHFVQQETDFVDFNIQKLLPHKFSEYGPALAAGDIDGNSLDDFVCGGSCYNSAQLFLQNRDGTFIRKPLLPDALLPGKTWDDAGILLFDADGDGDADLYIASGGFENQPNTAAYQDHFYLNDGKGNFSEDTRAIPLNFTSKSCVRAADIDKDGDLDLFIAGRVDPWNYPRPVSSFIYRNDARKGHSKFTDITAEVANDLLNIGLVSDALFTDFNNDGWTDLILAGEWMPITLLRNEKGVFKNISAVSGINDQAGWWTSITPGDFDHDGDIDYIVGNLGLNSFYRANAQYPASIYSNDIDNNGSYDAFMSIYLPASQQDTTKKEFPVNGRDDIIKQMISMRSKFQNYKSFAASTMSQLFTDVQLRNVSILKANNFQSSLCRNNGNNTFALLPLPVQAQLSVLNGMIADDFDGDGNLDILINGNDWGTEVSTGRYDALNGLLLKGNGKGGFTAESILESGIFIPGNGKALVKLRSGNGRYLVVAGQNRGPLKLFELKRSVTCVSIMPDDISAELIYADGHTQKQEFYHGSSFLSQSARFLNTDNRVKSVIFINSKNQKRTIAL